MFHWIKFNKCKLKEKVKVYCPIMKAKLTINSTLIEQMGEFTQFILYSIGKGFSIEDINLTIELGEYLIREEIYHLEKWGLIESYEEDFILTDLGESYFKIIQFVEYINNEFVEVQINCFNGIIMEDDGQVIAEDSCEEGIQKLKVDIVKELYQNKNYGNSKEFFIDKFSFDIYEIFDLLEEELDSINITLSYQPKILYKTLYLNEVDRINQYLNIEDEEDGVDISDVVDISIARKIIKLKIKLENEELQKYRYTLDTLRSIELFDNELLSSKARNILYLWQEEKDLQNSIKDVFYDTATNELITDFVKSCSDSRLYKLNVPQIHDVNQVDCLELQRILDLDSNYKIQVEEDQKFYFYNNINSKCLEKERVDVQ